MTLKYRTTSEDKGVEWAAFDDSGSQLGPWHQYQWQARLDAGKPIPQGDGDPTEL